MCESEGRDINPSSSRAATMRFPRCRSQVKVIIALTLLTLLYITTTSVWTSRCSSTDPWSEQRSPDVMVRADLRRLENSAGDTVVASAVEVVEMGPGGLEAHVEPVSTYHQYEPIQCLINGEYSVDCRKEAGEVYLPFSFVGRYFEMYGQLTTHNGVARFEWEHSNARIFFPKAPYDPGGVFMSFQTYNVEKRDRVKCISGVEGVPVSTQWGPQGYFYPTQVAQFGLMHYSKNLTETEPRIVVHENAEGAVLSKRWTIPDRATKLEVVYNELRRSKVVEFHTPDNLALDQGATLMLNEEVDLVISFMIKFTSAEGSVSVVVDTDEKRYTIHYRTNSELISKTGDDIFYGIGARTVWGRITRNVYWDLRKGIGLTNTRQVKKKNVNIRRITKMMLRGSGFIDDITVTTKDHMAHFYDAADWLVRNQNDDGGWPINVKRDLVEGVVEIQPGWYSAMAQGQALSLLTRAYRITGDYAYLSTALRATEPFRIKSQDHGVLAVFMDKYDFYEEYPTVPSSFVLNGFIYSLLGLYDLKMTAQRDSAADAEQLFDTGMRTLKAMLPLYDTGSGTIYDLKHIALGIAPNLARWDYHATHVNQLLTLCTIDHDPILRTTVERWIGYMKGKRAKHN